MGFRFVGEEKMKKQFQIFMVLGVLVLILALGAMIMSNIEPPERTPPPSAMVTEYTVNAFVGEGTPSPTPTIMANIRAGWIELNGEVYVNGECRLPNIVCANNYVIVHENGYLQDGDFEYPCDGCKIIIQTPGTPESSFLASATPPSTATPIIATPVVPEIVAYVEITGENINLEHGLFVRDCGASLYNTCRGYNILVSCTYHPELNWCTSKKIPVYEIKYKDFSATHPHDAGWWGNVTCYWADPHCGKNDWIPLCLDDGRDFVDWC